MNKDTLRHKHPLELTRNLLVCALVSAFLCQITQAQTILLKDTFTRGTAASPLNLNGSNPVTGKGSWVGPGPDDGKKSVVTDGSGILMKTVGSNAAVSTILIDKTLAANTEYALSILIPSFSNQGDSWVSVGLGNQNSDNIVGGVFFRNEGGNWITQKDNKPQYQEIFDRYSANDPTDPKAVTKVRITLNTVTKTVKFYLGDNKAEDYAYKYPELPASPEGIHAFVKLFSGNGTASKVNSARFSNLAVTRNEVGASELKAEASAQATEALLKKIADEYTGPLTEDSKNQPNVPKGEFINGQISDSKIYPGTDNPFTVYIPAQYNPAKPACLLIKLDGLGGGEQAVLDNLIAKGDIPVMIGVGVVPGTVWKTKGKEPLRFNRSYEFDSMNDNLADYILNELLPQIEKLTTKDGRPIHLSRDGNDRVTFGGSTGGIGAFSLAWTRPDAFRRVYSIIGTFVAMRGGNEYPALIRKTEPKPIRIFLEDGTTDVWNPLFGSWFTANENMEAALSFAGYDVKHIWGDHGHDGRMGTVIFPDVMRWLWRDYPAPLQAGRSQNDMLRSILMADEGWQVVGKARQDASTLASNQKGEVFYGDNSEHAIYKLDTDGKSTPFVKNTPVISGEAFGPNGSLYVMAPGEQKIMAYDASGKGTPFASGLTGHSLLVSHDGSVYATEPGAHPDESSKVWLIKPTGEKSVIDQGLSSASGVTFLPDKQMLFVAEAASKWVFSYVANPDASLTAKQRFYWLHMTDIPNDSGAQEMVVDNRGNLYVATRMGIQVCDRNGRVRGILPLPTPCGPVRSLCWGGSHFDFLFASDGKQIFKRKLNIHGYSQWAAPALLPPASGG